MEEAGIYIPAETSQVTPEEDMDLEQLLQEIDELTDKTDTGETASKEELSELERLALDIFGKKTVVYSKKEIEKMLQDAIEYEQYERAAQLKRFLELMNQ